MALNPWGVVRLKKLELFGFKSFADKVPLNFDADVIGLVGPNGCGKSNIVDAMLWVLGEQSAKSLRAEKMHDVLFAGAEGVKPVNFAEVALTLTDVANFPGGDEVTISRRLYRDGEMQYLINRKEVRLKDVNELFLGTGAGKNAFFVFEQGKIDEIINMTPEKRRAIFEETAGISRFLQKKKEANSELTEVDKNYQRLNDLHGEIERQLRTLQRQAAKAKNYQESKQQLHYYEKAIAFSKAMKLHESILVEEAKRQSLDDQYAVTEEKLKNLDRAFAEYKQKEEASEKERQEQQKHLFQIDSSLKLAEVEIRGHVEAIARIEDREKKALLSREKLNSSQEEKKKEKGELLAQLAAIEEEKKIVEADRHEKEKIEASLEKENAQLLLEEKKVHKELLEMVQKESSLKNRVHEKEIKKEATTRLISQFDQKFKELEQSILESGKKAQARKSDVDKLSLDIEKDKAEIVAFDKEGDALKKAITSKTLEKDKSDKELAELSAQIKALVHLQKAHVGFSNGAKTLLKEALDAKSELYGRVEELYKHVVVQDDMTLAMRFYEETLVVNDEADLALIFNFAQKKKLGDFSLILKKDIKKSENQHSFGECLAAKDVKEAMALKKKNPTAEIVTSDGFFIDRHGVFFCRNSGSGNGSSSHSETSLFVREAEVKKRQSTLDALTIKHNELVAEWERLLGQKKEWDAKRFTLDEKRRKKEMSLVQENFYLQRAIEDQNAAKAELSKIQNEKEKQLQLVETLQEEWKQASSLYDEVCQKTSASKAIQMQLEQQLKEKKALIAEKNALVREVKNRFDKVMGQFYALKEKIKILEIKRDEEKREHERLSLEIAEGSELKGTFFAKKENLELERSKKLEEKEKRKESLNLVEESLKIEKASKKQCEQEIHNEKKKNRELEKEKHHTDLLLTEKKTAFEALLKQIQETFHFTFAEIQAQEVSLDISLKEAEERVYRLRYELEDSSSINLASIEECEAQEKRFTELDGQLEDVKKAKADLEKIIGKLDSDSRKLFKSTFEEVRKNFQKNFQILFNGGEADLTFTQEEDQSEKGVEIIAKPPGKKMRSLSLLSGGEKCMTTLALLFALFEVKPAPFCILDEVDAPLDEANVNRFTALLKEFVPKTQFIIVTHNKKTMAAADMLVGVSMEKRGVSKLVSLAFTQKSTTKLESSVC